MESRLLNKKDVCNYLGISLGSLNGLIKRRKINYVKFERSVRFKKEDIDNVVNKNLVSYE
jgi:excisionase family DNA binding protein